MPDTSDVPSIVERFLKSRKTLMTRLRIFLCRLWALVRSRQMDCEIDDEITSHLGEATEEYVEQGLSQEEARWAALRSFGGGTADQGGVSPGAVIHVAGGIVA